MANNGTEIIMLEEYLEQFKAMTPEQKDDMKRQASEVIKKRKFIPNPGPQTDAYNSKADITLYGGQAGGGKTFLELGTAIECHQKSIIFRREGSQTDGLEADGKAIIGNSARYNGVDKEWSWKDGKSLKLAGMKEPDDWMKHAGRERDYYGFDEAGEFLELQIRSLIAWLRAPLGQRCRIILASNPPRTADGLWMMKWFAPWLDRTFHNPAIIGELRWALFIGNEELRWVDGPGKYDIDGEEYTALSLTFIPASLKDNPYRNTDDYRARLQSLPEPLRSQLLYGDFTAGIKDGDSQLIPTEWIIAAQNRWTPNIPAGMAMTCMALDPAGGGADSAEIAIRYGGWYAPLISAQGSETADGSATAGTIVKHRRDGCPVIVDVGGGYGGSVIMRLKDNNINCSPFDGSKASLRKTKDGQLTFANKRSEAWWRFREELDPDQEGGSAIALPPDPELRSDLAAPTWKLTTRGIQVEPKVIIGADGKVSGGIKKRLGRSPGKGDAVVMNLSSGNDAVKRSMLSSNQMANKPKVHMGHDAQRRNR